MALGKLWNAFFGKRTADPSAASPAAPALSPADQGHRSGTGNPPSATAHRGGPAGIAGAGAADPAAGRATPRVLAETPPPTSNPSAGVAAAMVAPTAVPQASIELSPRGKSRRAAGTPTGKKKRAAKSELAVAAASSNEPQPAKRSIPVPKRNAWSQLVAGKSVGSILETRLGTADRAVEVLEAIVCDAVPTPKLVAIDSFDLNGGGITVMQFHQRVRSAGGQAVPVPAPAGSGIAEGLRQISRTLGTVDLLIWDPAQPVWQDEEVQRLIVRVTHPATTVLRQAANGRWEAAGIASILAVPATAARAA